MDQQLVTEQTAELTNAIASTDETVSQCSVQIQKLPPSDCVMKGSAQVENVSSECTDVTSDKIGDDGNISSEQQSKKLDPKELIRRKLEQLEQKQKEEEEKKALEAKLKAEHEAREKALASAKEKSTKSGEQSSVEAEPLSQSERIVEELFQQFLQQQNRTGVELVDSTSNIGEEKGSTAGVTYMAPGADKPKRKPEEEGEISDDDDDFYKDSDPQKKKKHKHKSSKKKKHKKSKYENPEDDPDFFNKPSKHDKKHKSKPPEKVAEDEVDKDVGESLTSVVKPRDGEKNSPSRKKRSLSITANRSDSHEHESESKSFNKPDQTQKQRRRDRSRSPGSRERKRSRSPHSRHGRDGSSSPQNRRRDRSRSRGRRASRSRSRERDRYKPRHRSWSAERYKRHRSCTPFIDKDKLRKIALQKVAKLSADGIDLSNLTHKDIATLKSGGASINELTAFCKSMAKKGDESSSDEEPVNVPVYDDDRENLALPYISNTTCKPAPIVMNIRNGKQIAVMTSEEKLKLRTSFPVSSGTQHRNHESSVWQPVVKDDKTKSADPVFKEPLKPPAQRLETSVSTARRLLSRALGVNQHVPEEVYKSENQQLQNAKERKIQQNSIFVESPREDIARLVADRLTAVRKLQENPNDVQAITKLHDVNKKTSQWSESKELPGEFRGHTGAKILTPQELMPNADPRHQAWFKQDQFHRAAPVKGGIGHFLLQKMGWQHGQGLGKSNEGTLEPLLLEFNTSRKGLQAPEEKSKKAAAASYTIAARNNQQRGGFGAGRSVQPAAAAPPGIMLDMSGKNPISALMEICTKRKWGSPMFEIIHESGPAHKKNFLMKVTVNNIQYQPCVGSNTKKQAKTECAKSCLNSMGMLSREYPINPEPDPPQQ